MGKGHESLIRSYQCIKLGGASRRQSVTHVYLESRERRPNCTHQGQVPLWAVRADSNEIQSPLFEMLSHLP